MISAGDVMRYDRDGHLEWPSDGMRAWVGAKAAEAPPFGPAAGRPVTKPEAPAGS